MLALDNRTPFPSVILPGVDKDDRETVSVLVKATYAIEVGRESAVVAAEQVPFSPADQPNDSQLPQSPERPTSSVRVESDACPTKPGTDVILVGNAYPARARAESADVELRAGPVQKTVRVFGERRWFKSTGTWMMSRPVPFDAMPLVYERAFGGAEELRNPVGVGFVAAQNRLDGVALPNLEDPRHLIARWNDRPPVAGFGVIGRHWTPRKTLAGTYDDVWQQDRCPLLPRDFDERYYNGAHPDLVAQPRLGGDERVTVSGATRGRPLAFVLPRAPARIAITIAAQRHQPALALDTVLIEPDQQRVVLSWRATVPCPRQFLLVRDVVISSV